MAWKTSEEGNLNLTLEDICWIWVRAKETERHFKLENSMTKLWRYGEEKRSRLVVWVFCLFVCFCCAAAPYESQGSRPGMEPVPPAMEAQGLNHWTTEAPMTGILRTLRRCSSLALFWGEVVVMSMASSLPDFTAYTYVLCSSSII